VTDAPETTVTPSSDSASDLRPVSGATEQTETGLDLETIHRDLEDVEAALARLDAGTYWTDEVTGAPLDENYLSAHPLARRNPGSNGVSS
jgi:RNA polymerase-binding transcription factor DksA